jgi:hypothetical protein
MSGARAARVPVRVLPAPAYDPPYDEDRPAGWWPPDLVQPLLELPGLAGTVSATGREPAAGPAPGVDRPPGGVDRPPGGVDRPPGGVDPTPGVGRPPAASPPTVAAAARFVNTCLEILNGYRPVSHFRALADPLATAAVLAEMTRAVSRLGPLVRREGLVRLRAMRTCEPRPGVAEIALVVGVRSGQPPGAGGHGQAWALAYRLERQHGRWHCTAARLL